MTDLRTMKTEKNLSSLYFEIQTSILTFALFILQNYKALSYHNDD